MNSNESFGIGLAEIWDPELHPDATYKRGQKMSNGRTCFKDAVPRQDYVEEDMDDSEPVVHERWNSLPKKIEVGATTTLHVGGSANEILGREQRRSPKV